MGLCCDLQKEYSPRRDSNPRPQAYEACAITTMLHGRNEPVARFELATLCLQGRCNNHYATPALVNRDLSCLYRV